MTVSQAVNKIREEFPPPFVNTLFETGLGHPE